MLGGSRYSDEDFAKADKLLETLLKRPTLSIQENFEKQFMNMKIMAVILIAWLGKLEGGADTVPVSLSSHSLV